MISSTVTRLTCSLDDDSVVRFAEGLIVAHPDLDLVEVAYAWCSPDQVRSVVDALRTIRTAPFRGESRELLMVVSDFTFESRCQAGLVYIDDAPFTVQDCEWLETEAMRAVIAVEQTG